MKNKLLMTVELDINCVPWIGGKKIGRKSAEPRPRSRRRASKWLAEEPTLMHSASA